MVTIDMSNTHIALIAVEPIFRFDAGGFDTSIYTAFHIVQGDRDLLIDPEEMSREEAKLVAALEGQMIERSEILEDGSLQLMLESDTVLRIDPYVSYEAWDVNTPDGLLVICQGGGTIGVFYPSESSETQRGPETSGKVADQ